VSPSVSSCAPTRHVSHQSSHAAADARAMSAFLAPSTAGGMDTAQGDNALEFEALSREISTRIHEFDRRIRALSTAMREDEATEATRHGCRGSCGTEETEWQVPSYPASVEREALRGHRSVSSGVDSDPDGLLFLTAFRGAAIHDAVHALEGPGRVSERERERERERESLFEDLDCEGDTQHVTFSRASLLMQSPLPFGGPEARADPAAWGAGALELRGTADPISQLQRAISMAHGGTMVADSLAMTPALNSQASYACWRPLPLAPHLSAGQRGVSSPVGSPCVSRCEALVASPDEEQEEEEGLFKAKSDDEGGEIGEDDKDGNWDMPFATDFDMPPQTSDLTWLSLATSTLDSIWNERQA
jgi:hypothetical protein